MVTWLDHSSGTRQVYAKRYDGNGWQSLGVGAALGYWGIILDAGPGIGFAIPINLVRGVMADLIEHGRVIRGWLGVGTETLTPAQAESLGLDDPFERGEEAI